MRRAIYTVLKALGLTEDETRKIMHRHVVGKGSIRCFEEIRHHELQFYFGRVYQQRRYFGENLKSKLISFRYPPL